MKAQNFNFNLKSTRDPESEQLLYVITMFKKERVKVSIGKKILVKCWNVREQRCIISSEFSERINRYNKRINKFLSKLQEDLEHDFSINNNFIFHEGYCGSKEFIKHLITCAIEKLSGKEQEEIKKKQTTPLEFFKGYIENMPQRIVSVTNTYTSPRTIGHHKCVYKRFCDFFKDQCIKNDFSVFDNYFPKRFENWAYIKRNYKSNTIPTSFNVLKVWLNEAVRQGLITDLSFRSYKTKAENVDNIYLTEDEIDRLYRLDIPLLMSQGFIDSKSHCEITRDLFVVGCWTGLRLSDLNSLNEANINWDNNTLTIIAQKTKQKVVIPLHDYVKQIYLKYQGKFPKIPDKSKSIAHLQHLAQLAGIDEAVTIKENRGGQILCKKYPKYQLAMNHTARRSFATNLYLKGAPTLSIMQLTGHTTEVNFLKYIKVTKEENAKMMRTYFK